MRIRSEKGEVSVRVRSELGKDWVRSEPGFGQDSMEFKVRGMKTASRLEAFITVWFGLVEGACEVRLAFDQASLECCYLTSSLRSVRPPERLRFRIWCLRIWAWCFGFRVSGFGIWVWGMGVYGMGFEVRVWGRGLGFRV